MELIYETSNGGFDPQVKIFKFDNFYRVEFYPHQLIPEHRFFLFETHHPLSKSNVNINTIEFHTQILQSVIISGERDLLMYLIRNGLDIKLINTSEIIHGMIKDGSVDTLRFLLDNGLLTIDDIKIRGYTIFNIINNNQRDDFKQYFKELNLNLENIPEPSCMKRRRLRRLES